MDPNELDPTQGEPEGETVIDPGNEPAPEQEAEASEEQSSEPEQEETPEPEKPEPEKPVEKKKISWELRRINEETNKRREAEKRAAELDAELKRLRGGEKPAAVATDELPTVDADQIRARARDEIRQEEAVRLATERFNEACNKTFEQGVAAYGTDFENAANTITQALGDEIQKRPEFLQVITELDNGHQVYYELSRNPEEAERLLKMPSHKMILEIARMSANVAKPAVKPISKAPAPVTPVGGQPKPRQDLSDDIPMDQFADILLRKLAGAGK